MNDQPETDEDILVLDAATLKDLEVFDSDAEGGSLFDFCNLTRTEGGARALKRRMAHPWSDASRILATQATLNFISAQRDAFDVLPSSFAAARVEHYLHEALPLIVQNNRIEFGFTAFSMWANNDSHYISIVRGVQFACSVIQTIRRFAGNRALDNVDGELTALVAELRQLINDTRLADVPEGEVGSRMLRILRLDQVFRVHEPGSVSRLLELLYEIDALVSLADVTARDGFVMPVLEQGVLAAYAQDLRHPFVPDPVGNPVELDQEKRVLFLTGPNMAGKTTYIRSFATALYFAHLGMGVPASSFRFVPVKHLFSSISMSDDLHSGISYFRAEALRMRAIALTLSRTDRVVALMDEPFKGTNVKDALDASQAILDRFAARENCLFMFSSHLIELSESITDTDNIDCRCFEADESGGRLQFDYQLRTGVSSQRLGMRVLKEEGVFDLLD